MKYTLLFFMLLLAGSNIVFAQKQLFGKEPFIPYNFREVDYVNAIKINARTDFIDNVDRNSWKFLEGVMKAFEDAKPIHTSANISYMKDAIGDRWLFITPPPAEETVNFYYVFSVASTGTKLLSVWYNTRYWYLSADTVKTQSVVREEDIIGNPETIQLGHVLRNIKKWIKK